jgi:hypothetical protein
LETTPPLYLEGRADRHGDVIANATVRGQLLDNENGLVASFLMQSGSAGDYAYTLPSSVTSTLTPNAFYLIKVIASRGRSRLTLYHPERACANLGRFHGG